MTEMPIRDHGTPLFSIIIPTHQRRSVVARAVTSCLSQDFANFEVIVVDDGSRDGTADAVGVLGDLRITVVEHELNLGVGPARNTGIQHSHGQWLVMLDSDDELAPGALGSLAARVASASPHVGNLASSCRRDDGTVTPRPAPMNGTMDYMSFLSWIDGLTSVDWFNCFRREVFHDLSYSTARVSEAGLHLDVARAWGFAFSSRVVAFVHTDVASGLTRGDWKTMRRWLLLDAVACAQESERILRVHGRAMRQYAPRSYAERLRLAALHSFLAGSRERGVRYATKAIVRRPGMLRSWGILSLGLLGPRPLAAVRALRVPALT